MEQLSDKKAEWVIESSVLQSKISTAIAIIRHSSDVNRKHVVIRPGPVSFRPQNESVDFSKFFVNDDDFASVIVPTFPFANAYQEISVHFGGDRVGRRQKAGVDDFV